MNAKNEPSCGRAPRLAACLCLVAIALPAQEPSPLDPAAPRTPMPVPVGFACQRGDRKIEIDGSLVDWPELPAIALQDLRQLSGTSGGSWRGEADCSGFAFLMWDEEALYFAATVKDEWHRALDPNSIALLETPVADSILLSFDPLRNTRSLGPDPGRADDAEFWLSEEPSHELLLWDRYRGTARVLDDGRVVVSHDRELSVTTYECRLPWNEILTLSQKAQPGLVFDMQLVIQDFDESTDPMPQTRIGWTFGAGVAADAALFGSVMLLEDQGELRAGLPTVPDRPLVELDARLRPEFWSRLAQELRLWPAAVHDGAAAPEAAGGLARFEALLSLDRETARHPRVDHVEFCQRSSRRMAREVAAAEQRGLPLFWDLRMRELAQGAVEPVGQGTARLHSLPQGGWLVRTSGQSFLVDPAAADAATRLWAGAEFALLREPLDMTRRNDQLLLRMQSAAPSRPYLAHMAFHLPRLLMSDMPLVEPGAHSLQSNGAKVTALGEVRADGQVAYGMGYLVELPGPLRLLFTGPSLRAEDTPEGPCDLLVLSPRLPDAVAVARRAMPRLTLIDDAFLCFRLPNIDRVPLVAAYELQRAILPLPSVLLAPGEHWDISGR